MIIRQHYINQIRPFYDSDLIKVITGIRRCGKSVILSQIAEELRSAGKQVLSINFENIEYSTERKQGAGHPGVHGAEGQRCSRHVPLHYHQEQEEHPRPSGAYEVQPVPQESHSSS